MDSESQLVVTVAPQMLKGMPTSIEEFSSLQHVVTRPRNLRMTGVTVSNNVSILSAPCQQAVHMSQVVATVQLGQF